MPREPQVDGAGPVDERSLAEHIKAWCDALAGLGKAALVLIAAGIVVLVLRAVKNKADLRTLTVEIDPKTDALLSQLGASMDLRATLLSDTNREIQYVSDVVKLQDLKSIVLAKDATKSDDDFSLKPFGLDTSTTELLKLVRAVFGEAPPPFVRIEAVCLPDGCPPVPGNAPQPPREVQLRVELGDGLAPSEALRFRLPAGGAGMQRALRRAMTKTSERLIEAIKPLVASVWYLNFSSPFVPTFDDETRRYLERSVGAATRAFQDEPEHRCIAEIVTAYSEAQRSAWQKDGAGARNAAIRTLRRIAQEPDVSVMCRLHAETNIPIILSWFSFCPQVDDNGQPMNESQRFVGLTEALDRLNDYPHKSKGTADPDWDRIGSIRLQLKIMQTFSQQIDGGTRDRMCRGVPPATSAERVFDPASVTALLTQIKGAFPVDGLAERVVGGNLLDMLGSFVDSAAPGGDAHVRYLLSSPLMTTIDSYVARDRHPHRRFMTKGALLFGFGRAAIDGRATPEQKQSFLEDMGLKGRAETDDLVHQVRDGIAKQMFAAAAISFENASATTSWPTEVDSHLEPLLRLGDARYAAGDTDGAERAYARGVEAFIDDDEPTAEILWLARVASHWATALVQRGACSARPGQDPAWTGVWRRLGERSDYDLCVLLPPEDREPAPPSAAPNLKAKPSPTRQGASVGGAEEAGKLGLVDVVIKPVQEVVRQCAKSVNREDRLATLDCLRNEDTGPVWTQFVASHSSAQLDEDISAALGASGE